MIGGALFAVVGLLFLFGAIHLFTATLYQSLFGALPNTALGAIAFIVFGASLLAGVVGRRLGARRSIAGTGSVLALAMIVATAVRQEWLVLLLSAAALIAGTQWLSLVHAARPAGRSSPLPLALPIALMVDLALRSGLSTVPVVAAPLPLAAPLVVIAALLFLASGLAAVGGEVTWSSSGPRGALGLLAVGPLLLVSETGGLNGAQIALAGGLGQDGGPSTQIGLLVAGIGAAAGAAVLARGLPARPAAAAAITIGAVLLWLHVPIASVAAGGALAAGVVMAAAVLTSAPQAESRSPRLAVVAFGVGWIVFVAATFVHYAYFGNREAVWLVTALVVGCALLAPPSALPRWRLPLAVTVGLLVIIVPAAALALTPVVPTVNAAATFRVMTYNIHQGFDASDISALDRQADTIAHEAPDVLVLEEVVRGWLIDEQHDALGYLSARLGMPYVFAPNIGDLYGNAILSRYPITEVRRLHYAKEPGLRYQPRGAIIVRIAGVMIIGTHLDENADASAVRMEQVRDLLRAWNNEPVAIIACDCNALPEAAELQLVTDSGFGDLALQSGGGALTFPAGSPVERIDYLFGIGVTPAQGHVVASTASDHRGVVVNVTRSVR